MPTDPTFYIVGWIATLLIALGKGAFGGGLAILGIPLLALVVDPLDAAIMVALLVAVMDLFAIQGFGRASWSKPDLLWLLPGLIVGIGIGYVVFTRIDPRIVTLLIGLVTLGFTGHWFLKGHTSQAQAKPVSASLALAAGTASGFTTFVAHAGGPPVAMYLLRRGLSKSVFTGTTIAFFTLGNLMKLPPYLALGWQKPAVLWAVLALAPAAPLGVWIGRKLHDRLEQKTLFFWCYVLLAIAALKLVADAALALMR
ncbi:MAG: sulfite exporter TauE/SafE family protein [Bosea sp. (in: a-proteobacteria)]